LRDELGYENVEGLELNKKSVDVARRSYGLKVVSEVEDLEYTQYDVILLFEVIEHLTNPAEVLSVCAELLKPGGLLFVTTPSVRNVPARFFPSHCVHYTGPSHVTLFCLPGAVWAYDRTD
jgi:2-polyprenyl-3-methyl-5-hydroxy-6-metoxy-1,4-benzoquinol methylase